MNSEIKLALIHSGENEQGSQPALMKWATDVLAQRAEFEPWLLEPANFLVRSDNAAVIQRREILRQLAEADAFLIITSEQGNVHHCALKAFIDQVSDCWHARPVAFIGYGGVSGGLCAISQLRQILAGQHAVPICNFVSFPDPWGAEAIFQTDQARLSMARMLVQLNWWARALKAAREQMPYERVG